MRACLARGFARSRPKAWRVRCFTLLSCVALNIAAMRSADSRGRGQGVRLSAPSRCGDRPADPPAQPRRGLELRPCTHVHGTGPRCSRSAVPCVAEVRPLLPALNEHGLQQWPLADGLHGQRGVSTVTHEISLGVPPARPEFLLDGPGARGACTSAGESRGRMPILQ